MREIAVSQIEEVVAGLCVRANRILPEGLCDRLHQAAQAETSPLGRSILGDLEDNLDAAREEQLPVCQDTGMAVVFADVGQDVHFTGGLLTEAVDRGVARGYTEGLLRKSIVGDPLRRVNTGDNTPAVLHLRLVEGDRVRLTVAPKGFGSENMSRMYMLTPTSDRQTVIDRICETVRLAGGNPCPPMVLGVGIGGDFETCALAAKRALCREVGQPHPDAFYAELERDALQAVNRLGIGPQGFGGDTTALWLAIEPLPTHIAGLPLAVNVGCHVTRHASCVL